jgi:hypothetical protein
VVVDWEVWWRRGRPGNIFLTRCVPWRYHTIKVLLSLVPVRIRGAYIEDAVIAVLVGIIR